MASIGEALKRAFPLGLEGVEATPRPCAGGCTATVVAPGPAWCRACADAADAADAERALATELIPVFETIPKTWKWAELGHALMAPRVTGGHNVVAEVCRRTPWEEGVTIFGAGGRGKTSLAVGILQAWAKSRTEIALDLRKTARFVSARMLPLAKGEHSQNRGGSEYTLAISAAFAVLDDLGSEGDMPHARAAAADVLAERFAWERPTVVTTFLEEPAIRQRYGDGIARRMFERALVLNLGGLS